MTAEDDEKIARIIPEAVTLSPTAGSVLSGVSVTGGAAEAGVVGAARTMSACCQRWRHEAVGTSFAAIVGGPSDTRRRHRCAYAALRGGARKSVVARGVSAGGGAAEASG